jgi:hypothetical protein
MEFVDDKKQESAAEKEEEEEEEETQPEEEDDSDDEEEDVPEQDKNAKNSALAVGYKYDRSFVVRGSQIGVFKHTPDNRLKFSTTIKNVRTPSGQRFQPRKYVILSHVQLCLGVGDLSELTNRCFSWCAFLPLIRLMLHNEDENLLLLHPTEQNKVFKMDLTRGDVVEEWVRWLVLCSFKSSWTCAEPVLLFTLSLCISRKRPESIPSRKCAPRPSTRRCLPLPP